MARLGTTNGPVGNKITGNTANSNSLYGIEVYQYGRKNIITGNTFNGNCVGGIHDWTNTFDIISFNIVTGTGGITCPNSAGGVINGGYGIRVGSGYYSQVVNNLVAGNNTSNLAGYPGIGVDGEGALNSFGMLVSDNTVRDHQASNDILVSSSALTTLGAATYYYVAVAYGTTGTVLAQSSEVSAVAGGGGSVLLSWSEYQGVAVYRVYRGTAPAGENVYYILPGPAYVDTGNVSTRNAGTPPGSGNSIANPSATVVAGGFDTQGIVVHDNALYGTTSVTPLSVGSNAWSYANPTSLTNPAASGNLRLNSGDSIVWRNNAGTGDIPLAKSAGDLPTFQGNIIPVIALGAQSNLRSATAALTFGSIPANSCSEQPIAVTGVPTTSAVFVSPQVSIGANFSWSAYVSASGTVQARVCNVTTGALTPSVQTWTATELQ
jgi:parallel beta-helix repeat protein